MYKQFFNSYWAICPTALPVLSEAIKRASAGAVDDAHRYGLPIKKQGATALVSMRGAIVKEAGWLSKYGFSGSRDTSLALKSAAADDDIDQIVMVIDSPGGSVDGLDELAQTVKDVNAVKPIVVQVDGMMASAAVYAASYASKIYAGRRDLIGSIGTRIALYDYSEMFKQAGIRAIPVDTGEHKSAGMMGTEVTPEQESEFQRIVDGYFADFLNVVQDGRGMDRELLELLADGRVFFANEEPLESGLIDGIQSLEQTLSMFTNRTSRRTAQARLALLDL
jgi:signal peptide peptidase SppA